jgi:pyrimidine operon attenuation protein/uracil phosphoribosyltransferase
MLKARLMDATAMERALTRISHEFLEKNVERKTSA